MTRQEAAQEAKRLKDVSGRRNALEWIKAFKFCSGEQWRPDQIAKMIARKDRR